MKQVTPSSGRIAAAKLSQGVVGALVAGLLVTGCWGTDRPLETRRLGISLVSDGVRIDYRVCEGDSIKSLAFVQSDGDQNPFGSGDLNVFVFTSDDITTLQNNGFVVLGLDRMEPGAEVGEIWFRGVYG